MPKRHCQENSYNQKSYHNKFFFFLKSDKKSTWNCCLAFKIQRKPNVAVIRILNRVFAVSNIPNNQRKFSIKKASFYISMFSKGGYKVTLYYPQRLSLMKTKIDNFCEFPKIKIFFSG